MRRKQSEYFVSRWQMPQIHMFVKHEPAFLLEADLLPAAVLG